VVLDAQHLKVLMPHSDTCSHPFGSQAVHESPTAETRTAEHHNTGHDLLGLSRSDHAPVDVALGQNLVAATERVQDLARLMSSVVATGSALVSAKRTDPRQVFAFFPSRAANS
jgi:hypothetical protein